MSIRMRVPLLVVRREFFNKFASGEKKIEYRRYGRMFNEGVFYPGRNIRIALSYDIHKYPTLDAIVKAFEIKPFFEVRDQVTIYRGLADDHPMSLIHVEVTSGLRDGKTIDAERDARARSRPPRREG